MSEDVKRPSIDKPPAVDEIEDGHPHHLTGREKILQAHAELYAEALEKYGIDGEIDPVVEKRLKRKLDLRIIPALGVCYFFYVSDFSGEEWRLVACGVADKQYVDKTTLSYAAIFGSTSAVQGFLGRS